MRKLLILLLLCNLTGFAAKANAVSEAAALFLLIQPSVRANGMAGTSVASLNHGALSIAFNPAHIGIAAFERSVNLEFYPSKTNWLPQFNIKGNSTQNIITRQGWELNILDIFTYRQGNYEDPDGSVFYDTAGFGLSFIGTLRFARFLNPEIMDNPILRFLSNHTDIEYNHSSFDANSATPLANTTFNAIKVSFF